MFKSFKYRIYPTKSQEELILKSFGACRFVYNLALETKIMAWNSGRINLSAFDLIKQLTELKSEYTWLKDVDSQALTNSISILDKSFINFYRKNACFPKFKSKWSDVQSFTSFQSISIKNNRIYIPKFKKGIKIKIHREIEGNIKNVTIVRTCTGKYFSSLLCYIDSENPPRFKINEGNILGLDLGIKHFLTTSDGDKIENPKFFYKLDKKIKYYQSKLSKYKGKKTKYKLAKYHEKIKNKRKDFHHKLSYKLVKENHSLAIENLDVNFMLKNHNLAKFISDTGWTAFISMLEYKTNWEGVNLIKIGRFDPSSKICSNCGYINKNLQLHQRLWTCNVCNMKHDRDINAAKNIKNFALNKTLSGVDRENHMELSLINETEICEA